MSKPVCPKCNSENLSTYRSICMDQECCGMPHYISCDNCYWEREFYSDNGAFEETWTEMGGKLEDLDK